jgi:hypothetical protein
MYGQIYQKLSGKVAEGFQGSQNASGVEAVGALIAIMLLIVIQLFIVKFLWNSVLVGLFSAVRPIKSLLHVAGLLILIAMIHPGCAV